MNLTKGKGLRPKLNMSVLIPKSNFGSGIAERVCHSLCKGCAVLLFFLSPHTKQQLMRVAVDLCGNIFIDARRNKAPHGETLVTYRLW